MARVMRDGLVDVGGDPHLVECAKVRDEAEACDCGSVPTSRATKKGDEDMPIDMRTDDEKKIANLVALVDAIPIQDRYDVVLAVVRNMTEDDRVTLFEELQGEFCFCCGEGDPEHTDDECPEIVEDDQTSTPPAEPPS